MKLDVRHLGGHVDCTHCARASARAVRIRPVWHHIAVVGARPFWVSRQTLDFSASWL